MPSPQILTDPDDVNQVLAYIGIEPFDFSDASYSGLVFLQASELVIRKLVDKVSADTAGLVPTVAQIMTNPPTAPATADDQLALRIATAIYVAYQFTHSSPNALSNSVKVGPVTVSRGNIGTQWKEQRAIAYQDVGMYLSYITGWPEATQTLFELSGPTSSGSSPDTLSGFTLSGRW